MVKIITDTTCGLPYRTLEERGIPVLPQIIIFGEESYRDDAQLDTATFLQKLRAAPALPTTAAPPPALFAAVLERLVAEGHTIICLHPSAELSGTIRAATVAAQEFPGADIRVVDTRSVAGPLAAMVLLADRWAKEGIDAETILARVHDLIARQRLYFLVDTLEYLHKGGRIGGAKTLVGGLLKVKPILTVRDGRVEPFEQQRTHPRAVARLRELVLDQCPRTPDAHLCVMQADAVREAQALAEDLAAELGFSEVPVYEMPPAVVVHAGPGVLGAGFFAVQ
jgi:DegV family protein with EDD domain